MKFIADENVEAYIIDEFRIRENLSGSSDLQILSLMNTMPDNYFVTHDRDFGELLFKHQIRITSGILYLRFHNFKKAKKIEVISAWLNTNLHVLQGNFVVLSEDRIRIKPLFL